MIEKKRYFVKFSYIDPNQKLLRIHDNGEIIIAVTDNTSCYDFVEEVRKNCTPRYEQLSNLVIDFMMELPV